MAAPILHRGVRAGNTFAGHDEPGREFTRETRGRRCCSPRGGAGDRQRPPARPTSNGPGADLSGGTRRKLVREHGFWPQALEYQERAGFRCEYCDADLLANVDVYHGRWARDHIIPRKAGGPDSLANYALACSFCNQIKRDWDPRTDPQVADDAGRDTLVAASRRYVRERRAERGRNREDLERELTEVRALIQREMEPGGSRQLP